MISQANSNSATKNFDAGRTDGAPVCCYYCGRVIPNGNWWARLEMDGGRVALCRPQCVEALLAHHDHHARLENSASFQLNRWNGN